MNKEDRGYALALFNQLSETERQKLLRAISAWREGMTSWQDIVLVVAYIHLLSVSRIATLLVLRARGKRQVPVAR